jgi:hypothetical protein
MALQRRNNHQNIIRHLYEQLQTRKLISAYGGVGSIIETNKGAIKIQPFNDWPFMLPSNKDNWVEIRDNLLLERLKARAFTKLDMLLGIPINTNSSFTKDLQPQSKYNTANAVYFPEWFYCSYCHRFDKIQNWWKNWKTNIGNEFRNDGNKNEKVRNLFTYNNTHKPNCYNCYLHSKRKYQPLEQVRFILTAPNGEMKDIPWEKWTTREKLEGAEDSEEGRILLNEPCCGNQELRYLVSTDFADYSGIRIQCKNPKCPTQGKQISLAGLYGLRLYSAKGADDKGKEINIYFKPVIRSSNSVYYPLTFSSIFLPLNEQQFSGEDRQKIIQWHNNSQQASFMFEALMRKYSIESIQQIIDSIGKQKALEEMDFRLREYEFIINTLDYRDEKYNNLTYENQTTTVLANYKITTLKKIKRIKLTTLQTGYTRQVPMDKDLFVKEKIKYIKEKSGKGFRYVPLTTKYTNSYGNQTKYLLANESFGEGIFLDLDKKSVENWFHQFYSTNTEFKKKINTLLSNLKKSEFFPTDRFDKELQIAKFVLVHTLSHLLIKELEFLCGYAATSLNERLFIDNDNMQGVLIYTIAGTEGSYGGLINQANAGSFNGILKSALFRANDCSSDPVCYHSDGQGIGGLNYAACYSCSLLPETSCEEFNCFLDRGLLINKDYGFYRNP